MSEIEELIERIERYESRIQFLDSKNKQKHKMCRDLTNKLYDNEERETKALDFLIDEVERLHKKGNKDQAQLVFDLYQKIGNILLTETKDEDEHRS